MKSRDGYFILNKKDDYEKGRLHNLYCKNNKLMIFHEIKGEKFFLSGLYDSGEADTLWHRMLIDVGKGRGNITLFVYSANDLQSDEGKLDTIRKEIAAAPHLSLEEIKQKTSLYLRKTESNKEDILLHDIKGRYVWFILLFSPIMGESMEIERIQLFFPKSTWVSFLPEVYQQDKESLLFLEKYLSIFKTLYDDLNYEIKNSFTHFQPGICNKDFLYELAKWVHIQNPYIWNEEQLRYLLLNCMKFYSYRGTVKALLEIVKLYTGERAYLIEQHKLDRERKGKRKDLIDSLYGTGKYTCTLLVREETVSDEKKIKTLIDIVEDNIPAQIECKIVVLQSYIFLDKHTYLGINSGLQKYKVNELL